MITIPTTIPADLSASLGDQLSDTGTLAVIIFIAAIPLAFYVIHKIIGLIPKDKKKEWLKGELPEVREFVKKYPEYVEKHKGDFEGYPK